MTFPEYLHEMPLNRIIYRKRVIKHAKKVFTQFYTIKSDSRTYSGHRPLQ